VIAGEGGREKWKRVSRTPASDVNRKKNSWEGRKEGI